MTHPDPHAVIEQLNQSLPSLLAQPGIKQAVREVFVHSGADTVDSDRDITVALAACLREAGVPVQVLFREIEFVYKRGPEESAATDGEFYSLRLGDREFGVRGACSLKDAIEAYRQAHFPECRSYPAYGACSDVTDEVESEVSLPLKEVLGGIVSSVISDIQARSLSEQTPPALATGPRPRP